MKFEEAYCTSQNRTYTVDEIFNLYKIDLPLFMSSYKEYFVCPECKKAKLCFSNAKHPYFKSYPKAIHMEDCSLKQDEMTQKQAELFFEENKNSEAIQRQMISVLSLLLSNEEKNNTKTSFIYNKPGILNIDNRVKKKTSSNRFPRKRIDVNFRPEDFGCLKLFYGQVLLKWEKEKQTCFGYKILLYHPKTNKLLCRLKVSGNVYKYILDQYKIPESFSCNIVFLASFDRDYGKSYQITHLRYGEYLVLNQKTSRSYI